VKFAADNDDEKTKRRTKKKRITLQQRRRRRRRIRRSKRRRRRSGRSNDRGIRRRWFLPSPMAMYQHGFGDFLIVGISWCCGE
jgi:hypothetical protein